MQRASDIVGQIMRACPQPKEATMDSKNNLAIWTRCEKPPASAIKPIQAGRLRGKSDINPQWRYRVMTEMFGPCGVGWWYVVRDRWTETVGQEVMCFVLVDLHVAGHEYPVQGIGGNKLAEMESRGLYANDEGWKMALTDALSVAMKALGVGAAVYEGRWDGSKYAERQESTERAQTQPAATAQPPAQPAQTVQTAQTAPASVETMTVKTCTLEKQGVSSGGKPWTLYRLTGASGEKQLEIVTFHNCADISVGDVVELHGITDQRTPGVYRAQKIVKKQEGAAGQW